MNKALIVGSLAFDIIFSVHGDIRDEIKLENGELGNVNLMFTANGKKRYFGGTAGNISYGLSLLSSNHTLFSLAGKDFTQDYEEHLNRGNADLQVVVEEEKFTATYYGISDEKYQQIGIWQPDAYLGIDTIPLASKLDNKRIEEYSVAIFSPGTGLSIRNHMHEFRQKRGNKPTVIFDPSQVLSIFFTKELLHECLSMTDIVVGNETEINQFEKLFGFGIDEIYKTGVKTIIETKGEKGVTIYTEKSEEHIDAIKPKKLVETTGAGDAFRAGLISGILDGKSIKEACLIGNKLGAACVSEYGGQLYEI